MRLPETPPQLSELLRDAAADPSRLAVILSSRPIAAQGTAYLHWDEVRHRRPPADLTVQEWWLGLKVSRSGQERHLPLADTEGTPFTYLLPHRAVELLHLIDQRASGEILLSDSVADPGSRQRYLMDSLMEEAIASSQLEGASTTRKVAKEMLRVGRRPRDVNEQMIVNNYNAIERIRESKGQPLTVEAILDLHRILTSNTLDDEGAAGRLQRPGDERVRVTDPADGTVLHMPPPAEQLEGRIAALTAFANAEPPEPFIHPVVRAIFVHLWLAYDHPFEDGNGRTARALFYWTMASQGYWLTEYLSISRLLSRARAQYRRSFLFTETDDLDATYFILHQLETIRRAIDDLHAHLRSRMRELRQTEDLLRRSDLDHRQLALLGYALRHPEADFTYISHARSHRVVRQSARKDILELEEKGFLERRRVGKTLHFRPVPDLGDRVS